MFRALSLFALGKQFLEIESTKCGKMINNAGTDGTECAGEIHEMDERTWDYVM